MIKTKSAKRRVRWGIPPLPSKLERQPARGGAQSNRASKQPPPDCFPAAAETPYAVTLRYVTVRHATQTKSGKRKQESTSGARRQWRRRLELLIVYLLKGGDRPPTPNSNSPEKRDWDWNGSPTGDFVSGKKRARGVNGF